MPRAAHTLDRSFSGAHDAAKVRRPEKAPAPRVAIVTGQQAEYPSAWEPLVGIPDAARVHLSGGFALYRTAGETRDNRTSEKKRVTVLSVR